MSAKTHSLIIAERDVHLRRLLADFLSGMGCDVRFFDDGYSALDHARQNPPALVITEVMVPRLDGLALCRLIKGDAALQRTKVMVLSVLAAESEARQSGADAFMKKPIEQRDLLAAIRSLVESTDGENRA